MAPPPPRTHRALQAPQTHKPAAAVDPFTDAQYNHLGQTIPSYRATLHHAGLLPLKQTQPLHHHLHSPRSTACLSTSTNTPMPLATTTLTPVPSKHDTQQPHQTATNTQTQRSGWTARGRHQQKGNTAGAHALPSSKKKKKNSAYSAKQKAAERKERRIARGQKAENRRRRQDTALRKGDVLAPMAQTVEAAEEGGAPCYCLLMEKLQRERLAGY